jgi:hypothetical protein
MLHMWKSVDGIFIRKYVSTGSVEPTVASILFPGGLGS